MVDRCFLGRVQDDGLLALEAQRDFDRHVATFKGKPVELVLRRRRTTRTTPQNKWLWGLALEMLVEEFGYDRHERQAAKEHLHYKLVQICFGTRWDPKLQARVPTVRSSHLTTVQFAEYMEWLVRYAATEYGTVIPLPHDIDLSQIHDEDA